MDEEDMQWFVGIISFIVLFLAITYGFAYLTTPFQTTNEIWLPEHYNILNKENGTYLPIYDAKLKENKPWDEFAQRYKTELSNESFVVVVQQDGTVFYSWGSENSKEAIRPITSRYFGIWHPGQMSGKVTAMPDDNHITLYCDRDWFIMGVIGTIIVGIVLNAVLSLFIGILGAELIDYLIEKLRRK